MLTPTEIERWTTTIARFAAPHIARGASVDEAINRGIADYTATLEGFARGLQDDAAGRDTDDARRYRALREMTAGAVWRAVRAA